MEDQTRTSRNPFSVVPTAPGLRRLGGGSPAPTVLTMPAGIPTAIDVELVCGPSGQTDVHLNAVGDVVAYDGVGEVMLLPHLWNFDRLVVGNVIVFSTSGNDLLDKEGEDGNRGMTAILAFDQVLARVEDVSETLHSADGLAHAS